MTHATSSHDVATANAEVLTRAAQITSLAALALSVIGSICCPLLGHEPPSPGTAIAIGIELLIHLVIEAGALVTLCALVSLVGWRHVLGRGRTLAGRLMTVATLHRVPRLRPASTQRQENYERTSANDGELIDRLVRCLEVAPSAPPVRLHLDADHAVRTLHPVRVEVRTSP